MEGQLDTSISAALERKGLNSQPSECYPWRMKPLDVTQASVQSNIIELEKVADQTLQSVRALAQKSERGLDLLESMKFQKVGQDPIVGTELNFIEQLNQTFTTLVSLLAADDLFNECHDGQADYKTITLNLGTKSGSDLVVKDTAGSVVGLAEVFAAVSAKNNQKLKKDIEKVRLSEPNLTSIFRRVYFITPEETGALTIGSNVIKLGDYELQTLSNGVGVKRLKYPFRGRS